MTEKKLDCVILGLLSHEDLTGYEIKHRMDTALSFFWGASYGSIYPTLGTLVKDGLAEKHTDDGSSRGRIIYSITDAGREHLKKWLSDTSNRDEIRYETLLKLFFGSAAGEETTAGHIRTFRDAAEENIAKLLIAEENLKNSPDDDDHRYYLMTVRFGLKTYRAYTEYCDELLGDMVSQK
ncbi:MAG: PadR family transcriptional regulator [Oscillospiraceae bacterium]|nr:PadR family transcriptional regulator [Oscillospiraceae bacterium]